MLVNDHPRNRKIQILHSPPQRGKRFLPRVGGCGGEVVRVAGDRDAVIADLLLRHPVDHRVYQHLVAVVVGGRPVLLLGLCWLLLLLMMMVVVVVTRLLLLLVSRPRVWRPGLAVLVSVAPLSPPQVPVPGLQLTGSGQRGPGRGWRGPTLVHAGAAAPSNHWDPLKI